MRRVVSQFVGIVAVMAYRDLCSVIKYDLK